MATFEEVQAYMAAHHTIEQVGDGVYATHLPGAEDGPEVFICYWSGGEEQFVALMSPIAQAQMADLGKALLAMGSMVAGGLVIWQGYLSVRVTLQIANIFDTDLDKAVWRVQSMARELQGLMA